MIFNLEEDVIRGNELSDADFTSLELNSIKSYITGILPIDDFIDYCDGLLVKLTMLNKKVLIVETLEFLSFIAITDPVLVFGLTGNLSNVTIDFRGLKTGVPRDYISGHQVPSNPIILFNIHGLVGKTGLVTRWMVGVSELAELIDPSRAHCNTELEWRMEEDSSPEIILYPVDAKAAFEYLWLHKLQGTSITTYPVKKTISAFLCALCLNDPQLFENLFYEHLESMPTSYHPYSISNNSTTNVKPTREEIISLLCLGFFGMRKQESDSWKARLTILKQLYRKDFNTHYQTGYLMELWDLTERDPVIISLLGDYLFSPSTRAVIRYTRSITENMGIQTFMIIKRFLEEPFSEAHKRYIDVEEVKTYITLKNSFIIPEGRTLAHAYFTNSALINSFSLKTIGRLASLSIQCIGLIDLDVTKMKQPLKCNFSNLQQLFEKKDHSVQKAGANQQDLYSVLGVVKSGKESQINLMEEFFKKIRGEI